MHVPTLKHTQTPPLFVSYSLYSLTLLLPLSICLPPSLFLPLFIFFSLHAPSFFLYVSLSVFILPPWLNHRWFKIHTYVMPHHTQTSVQTIFKPWLITSAPPGGRGKGKSRPYLGPQQLLKWNKKDTMFSYKMLSRQKHINVVRRMYRGCPSYSCLFNSELCGTQSVQGFSKQ